jgi:sulfur-carrier protein adenylyltransferase/sulfurtransferase
MVTLHIPIGLRSYTGQEATVRVEASTLGEALEALFHTHEALKAPFLRCQEAGRIQVFIGAMTVNPDAGQATPVPSGGEVTVVMGRGVDEGLPALSTEEIGRYSRHLILDEVGMVGQQRLKAARVLCVGTGGLGSPLLMYLAAAGVGRIGIVDFDMVELSNLHRQVIHGSPDVGRSKVASAAESLAALNPNVQVDCYDEALTSSNALRILADYDIVVDGTDNFPARYLVNDACVLLGKPNVYGSIFKFEGQASVFNYQGGPNYRDLYPEPPPPGLVPSCAEGGVLGILPGIIGLIQATETVKIILGSGTTLSGRLLLYDAMSMRFRELSLSKDPNGRPITTLIDYRQFCGFRDEASSDADAAFSRIEVTELDRRRRSGWSPFVLDVRRSAEAEIVRLSFTDRLQPHGQVTEILDALPRDRDIVVYCKGGTRSALACASLVEQGFTRIFNLEGGITAWANQVEPALPTY